VNDHLIAASPAATVKRLSVPRRQVVPWRAAQVAAVRAALPQHYAATADAGARLGMRQGETFGLAREDIDWPRGSSVHVRRQVRLVSGQLVFSLPKGNKERRIDLPEPVKLRFAAHMRQHPPAAVTLPWIKPGGKPVTAWLIFTTPSGGAVNRNGFNAAWRRALDAAGIARCRENMFHVLRHTFASVLLADGVGIGDVADFMGDDPALVLRTYRHMMPKAGDRMRSAISAAMAEEAERRNAQPRMG